MARRLIPPNVRPAKPRTVPKSRAMPQRPAPDLPRLDRDGLPTAFVATLRAVRSLHTTEKARRVLLGYLADAEAKGHDRTTLVTFIWAMRGFQNWLRSEERQSLWEDAEKRRKLIITTIDAFEVDRRQRSQAKHAAHWGTTYEALVCLGFALKCGEQDHSLRLWRLIEPALLSEVFSRQDLLQGLTKSKQAHRPVSRIQSEDFIHGYSERIRQRLLDHRGKVGAPEVRKKAEAAFDTVGKKLLAPVGIHNIHKHPSPRNWGNP